jgi:hypothetical protein
MKKRLDEKRMLGRVVRYNSEADTVRWSETF